MSKVKVQKVEDTGKDATLREVERRLEAVRRLAYELSEKRKQGGVDSAMEDWLKAERDILGWAAAEVTERNSDYEILVTLPGFEAKDIQVTMVPSAVIVHAAMAPAKKKEQGKILWTEFGTNDVYRRIELPGPVNVDKITAQLDRGILRIKAPKAAAVKPKKIAVAAA